MRLNVIDAGPHDAGPSALAPVVLIHGLFGQARNLGRLQRSLAETRRVVAFDLRSHGASPHGPLDLQAMADDVVETMAALGLPPSVLVGHSLGGKTAMVTALRHPGLVRRLLVADIAPVPYRHDNERYARALQALELSPGLRRTEAHRRLAAAIPDSRVRDLLLQNLEFGEAPHWRIGLDDIARTIPDAEGWPDFPPGTAYEGRTLFLRAELSNYIRPEHEAAIRRFFPRATIVTLRDAGHWLHADRPDEFLRIVADFVAGEDAVRS